jgi:hypothetical protein
MATYNHRSNEDAERSLLGNVLCDEQLEDAIVNKGDAQKKEQMEN